MRVISNTQYLIQPMVGVKRGGGVGGGCDAVRTLKNGCYSYVAFWGVPMVSYIILVLRLVSTIFRA